jgi:hypothetical protein
MSETAKTRSKTIFSGFLHITSVICGYWHYLILNSIKINIIIQMWFDIYGYVASFHLSKAFYLNENKIIHEKEWFLKKRAHQLLHAWFQNLNRANVLSNIYVKWTLALNKSDVRDIELIDWRVFFSSFRKFTYLALIFFFIVL